MQPRGSYKISRSPRRAVGAVGGMARHLADAGATLDEFVGAIAFGDRRAQRIVDSLRREIVDGGPEQRLSIRRVFETPREVFRVELDLPGLSYQRTTLLDREALEELLEAAEVRDALDGSAGEFGLRSQGQTAGQEAVRHG